MPLPRPDGTRPKESKLARSKCFEPRLVDPAIGFCQAKTTCSFIHISRGPISITTSAFHPIAFLRPTRNP